MLARSCLIFASTQSEQERESNWSLKRRIIIAKNTRNVNSITLDPRVEPQRSEITGFHAIIWLPSMFGFSRLFNSNVLILMSRALDYVNARFALLASVSKLWVDFFFAKSTTGEKFFLCCCRFPTLLGGGSYLAEEKVFKKWSSTSFWKYFVSSCAASLGIIDFVELPISSTQQLLVEDGKKIL